jgi:hypothetical protein
MIVTKGHGIVTLCGRATTAWRRMSPTLLRARRERVTAEGDLMVNIIVKI